MVRILVKGLIMPYLEWNKKKMCVHALANSISGIRNDSSQWYYRVQVSYSDSRQRSHLYKIIIKGWNTVLVPCALNPSIFPFYNCRIEIFIQAKIGKLFARMQKSCDAAYRENQSNSHFRPNSTIHYCYASGRAKGSRRLLICSRRRTHQDIALPCGVTVQANLDCARAGSREMPATFL